MKPQDRIDWAANLDPTPLFQTMKGCQQCLLSADRRNVVIGEGQLPAEVFIIGEGPGTTEDHTAVPFSGMAGVLLRRTLDKTGLLERPYFFTNVVKCKPPLNRTPEVAEVATCTPWTVRLFELAKPLVIISVGSTARDWVEAQLGHVSHLHLVHPAAILHGGTDKEYWIESAKRVAEKAIEVCSIQMERRTVSG